MTDTPSPISPERALHLLKQLPPRDTNWNNIEQRKAAEVFFQLLLDCEVCPKDIYAIGQNLSRFCI